MKLLTYTLSTLQRLAGIALISTLMSCNSGSDLSDLTNVPEDPNAPPPWWESQTPDFSANPDRPVISITGPKTLILGVDEEYQEQGATAQDLQDGDISSLITIESNVDTSQAGDYLVRYQVTDANQLDAIEAIRVVRVFDEEPVFQTARPFGTTVSHWGYFERLPVDYGVDPDQQFPLLVYNHGNAGNAVWQNDTPEGALSSLILNAGPPLIISAGKWDSELPFIVLSPQVGDSRVGDPIERMDAFLEHALASYNIDRSRIYMTGWSQGGFISFLYSMSYPEKVAAAISMAGGLLPGNQVPENLCNIESVPLWAFHGDADSEVPVSSSLDSINTLNQNCNPVVPPLLTVFQGQQHLIHHAIFNLSALEGGTIEFVGDPNYDLYQQSIYDWLLSYTNPVSE